MPEHDGIFDDIDHLTVGSADMRGDAYAKLMKREARVLKTVNRVVNEARKQSTVEEAFLNMSLQQISVEAMRKLHLIMDDLMHIRELKEVVKIFWHGDRKIYTGILLILSSFVLFFATAAK